MFARTYTHRSAYLPADARCRQLERLVKSNPGITLDEIRAQAQLSYQQAAAYMQRLVREERVLQVAEGPRGWLKRFYPPGFDPTAERKAA